MSAGAAALRSVFTPQRARALFAAGESLLQRLNALCRDQAPAAQFTGLGSTINIHFHRGRIRSPEDLVKDPKGLTTLFHFDLMEQGIFCARRGQANLSLPMGTAEFDALYHAVAVFLERRAGLIEATTPRIEHPP
jgi:glutamate-1-semialdehyde 2,1-aminomutase